MKDKFSDNTLNRDSLPERNQEPTDRLLIRMDLKKNKQTYPDKTEGIAHAHT